MHEDRVNTGEGKAEIKLSESRDSISFTQSLTAGCGHLQGKLLAPC